MKSSNKKEVFFHLSLKKKLREKIKLEAFICGYSMNDFIVNCVENRLKKIKRNNKKKLTTEEENL